MNIENQVCTLEQAKLLRSLGIHKTSLFCYAGTKAEDIAIVYTCGYDWHDHPGYCAYPLQFSAFTVAELSAMLPDYGYKSSNIVNVLKQRKKLAYGFKWEYAA
jgi:hypothetical protein